MRPTLKSDLRWGLGWARWFIVGFSVLATVIYAVRPLLTEQPPVVELYRVLLAYIGGGLVAGLTVGLLRPLGRSRPGATLLGIVTALPAYYGCAIALFGLAGLGDPVTHVATVLLAVIVGGYLGATSLSSNRRGRELPS